MATVGSLPQSDKENVPPAARSTLASCRFFFFKAEDGIRDSSVTGVQTCALPICHCHHQWIQMYARTHEFRIKQVQRQDMEQHNHRAKYYVRGHSLEYHQRYHKRGSQSQRETDI